MMTDLEIQRGFDAETALLEWRKQDLKTVQQKINEHKKDMGMQGAFLRMDFLIDQLESIDEKIFQLGQDYWKNRNNISAGTMITESIKEQIDLMEKYEKELQRRLNYMQSKDTNGITPEMIERARDYPIENLLTINKGMANCVFHQDKNPSMCCKNNFVYCFSCGKSGDAIDVYRAINGGSFHDAVKSLQ